MRWLKGNAGLGMTELLLFFALFASGILALMSLTTSVKNQVINSDPTTAENYQYSILSAIMDGTSWARTLNKNNVPLPTTLSNPATTPLSNPPSISPPDSNVAPFPVAAQPFDLLDAAGNPLVSSRSSPTSGLTLEGAPCTGATSPCPLRFELRWWIPTSAANPLVTISATLRVLASAKLNPLIFSFDNTVDGSFKKLNPISRHLFPSWVSRGLIQPANPQLANLILSSVPPCPADFIPGNFCGMPGFSGSVGRSCICPISICKNGRELFRCQ